MSNGDVAKRTNCADYSRPEDIGRQGGKNEPDGLVGIGSRENRRGAKSGVGANSGRYILTDGEDGNF